MTANHMNAITSRPFREATSDPDTANTTAAMTSKNWTSRKRLAGSTIVGCMGVAEEAGAWLLAPAGSALLWTGTALNPRAR
jgi:hypothetical protein